MGKFNKTDSTSSSDVEVVYPLVAKMAKERLRDAPSIDCSHKPVEGIEEICQDYL